MPIRKYDRYDTLLTAICFLGTLTLYIRTLAPSLLFGDSAEFQTIAYTLGIGHPTGYPIYIVLAKFFTFLPVGDVAYRVNLFSAFCAALTVGVVYQIIRKLSGMYVAALYGSLALAWFPLFWKHASIAETYTPSAACLAFILFAVLHWKETHNPRWLFIAGILGGLSLGIHTNVALAAPAILIYMLVSPLPVGAPAGDNMGAGGRIRFASFGLFIGIIIFLSSFLLLDFLNSPAGYYNSVVRPSLSLWDMTPSDFDSPLERLAFLYFPPQFKGQFFAVSLKEIATRLTDFAVNASWNLLLVIVGFSSLVIPRKGSPSHWREAVLLILALITFLAFATTYNVFDFYVYYIPVMMVLVIFAGLGINLIVELTRVIPKMPRFLPAGISIVILLLGIYPSSSEVFSHVTQRIPPGLDEWETHFFKHPNDRRLEAEEILNRLEDNAIFFTDWDQVYNFYYVAHILQGRTEMGFHETYPQDDMVQFAESAIQYLEANLDAHPVYFSERLPQLANKYKITRAGQDLFRIERK
jgi:hypothetical protein